MSSKSIENRLELRKAPTQERSRQTFDWILEAACEIFEKRKYDEVTTNEIAKRAGVSVGSIYQYFPNKDSILLQILKQISDTIFVALEDTLQGFRKEPLPSISSVVQEMLQVMLVHNLERPNLHRLCWDGPQFSKDIEAFKQEYRKRLCLLIQDFLCFHPQAQVSDPALSAWILVHLITSLFHEYITQFGSFTDGAFFQELYRLIMAYLSSTNVYLIA